MPSFSLAQLAELSESFRLLNTSDTTLLTPKQVVQTLHSFGYTSVTKEHIVLIMRQYDIDNKKSSWDLTQFIAYLFHHLIVLNADGTADNKGSSSAEKTRHFELLEEIFNTYDSVGKGFITSDDISEILSFTNEACTPEILAEMMNGKDKLSREEFFHLMKGDVDEGLILEWEGEQDDAKQTEWEQQQRREFQQEPLAAPATEPGHDATTPAADSSLDV